MSSTTLPKTGNLPKISRDQLRRTCSRFATGVAVVTTMTADGRPHGLTVNSFTSVSAEPPMILVCLDERSSALPHVRECRFFGVNLLSEAQSEISKRFAGVRDDRFEGISWHPGAEGAPLIEGGIGNMECEVAEIIPAGDHFIVLGHVLRACCREGRPLLFFGSCYGRIADGE